MTRRLLKQEYKALLLSQALSAYGTIEYELLRIAEDSKKKDFTRGNHVDAVNESGEGYVQSYNTTHDYEKDINVIRKRKKSSW